MKITNRVELHCSKQIHKNVIDHFSVMVSKDKADEAKKEYQRQGYTVK